MMRMASYVSFSIFFIGIIAMDCFSAQSVVPNSKTESPDIQAIIDSYLPKVSSKNQKEREQAIFGLREELQTLWNTKHISANERTRNLLSKELIRLYKNTTDNDFSIPARRTWVLDSIVVNGDNVVAKPFLLELLETGTEQERNTILAWIGRGHAVTGEDVYMKVKDLGNRGLINRDTEIALLARIDKAKALPEILENLKSSNDKKVVFSAARTLQNTYHKPEYFRQILPRLKAVELDKQSPDGEPGDGLFFIDHDLLTDYIGMIHQPDESRLALEIFNKSGGASSIKSIPILSRKINDNDPGVRLLAAKSLRHAMNSFPNQASEIEKTIKNFAEHEKDPKTKKALKDMLDEIKWSQDMHQRHKERLKQGKPK